MKKEISKSSFRGAKKLGSFGEQIAVRYLQFRGYMIVGRNVYARCGEIDIVAVDGDTKEHVFVEVKLRRTSQFGGGIYAINEQKMKKLYMMVDYYILAHPWVQSVRIDGLFIEKKAKNQLKIEHLKNIML